MEQSDDKNYVKIMGGEGDSPERGDSKTAIHTMPKRYMASLPASNHAKSTGVLILVLGFLFLVVALMLFYFFVLKKEPLVEPAQTNSSIIDRPVIDIDPNDLNSNNNNQRVNPPVDNAPDNSATNQASSSIEKKPLKRIDANNPQTGQYLEANDSDRDGLSDLEELLFGSSPNSEDTDGDGYLDQIEILNLWDPTSRNNLIDSLNVEKYDNEEYNFSVFISSLWTVEAVSGNESLIVYLGKDQYIQIMSQTISSEQDINTWYMDLFEVDEVLDEQVFKKGYWNGIINESKLTVYLAHPNKQYIITLNYELGNDNTLYYKNVFDMMLRSISMID